MSLSLNNFLKKTSRCLIRRVTREVHKAVFETGIWPLQTIGDERHIWERLLIDDLIILLDIHGSSIELIAARIAEKSLNLSIPKSERPLMLSLQIVGNAKLSKLPLHGYLQRCDFFCSPGEFSDLWNKCSEVENHIKYNFSAKFFSWNGIDVRVASSQSDLKDIGKFSESHSFGYRKAYLTLIANKSGKRLGAILGEPCISTRHPHRSSLLVFGSYYTQIRNDSISIVRIFNNDNVSHKMDIHEALIRAFCEFAPFVVDGQLRIIEAVSYDYHPLALKLGFNVVMPDRPEGSFYYWKPINIPKNKCGVKHILDTDIIKSVHDLLNQRKKLRYFIVHAPAHSLEKALEIKAWAIENSRVNKGIWKLLDEGNLVFFISDRQYLNGYGIVKSIEFDQQHSRFPLRINFSSIDLPVTNWDITDGAIAQWVYLQRRGGIFRIAERAGSEFKHIIDRRITEGKMWVIPNQYLLPGMDFIEIPKQIFVVQSWDLRESVLPELRDILGQNGYTVTHAEDREGQIVFGDVWKLLNEAEVILVDFTQKRPNVYLEYGMALVLGKPIVAITQNIDDTPSDTPHLKVLLYENTIKGRKNLSSKLPRAVADKTEDIARSRK